MAHVTLLELAANAFVGDNDAQLVGGDVAAVPVNHIGRPAWAFDDTAEAAIVSGEVAMPGQYAVGTLKATIHWAAAGDNTNDVRWDIYVEAKTPNTDTLDMEAATSWDTVNSISDSAGGSTVGDPLSVDVTLTNKDSVAASDLVRFGVRRDCDYAAGDNDDLVGDAFIYSVEIWEDT